MLDFLHEINKAVSAGEKSLAANQAQEAAKWFEKVGVLFEAWAAEATSREGREKRQARAKDFRLKAAAVLRSKAAGQAPAKLDRNLVEAAGRLEPWVGGLIRKSSVTWDDIGGLENLKDTILDTYFFELARKPDRVQLSFNTNFLLVGPPGTGKTLIAAAVSGEIEATFFHVDAAGLLSKYFGESGKNIALLYKAAEQMAPSVLFYDEFEALTRRRGLDGEAGAERRVLTQILQEMDGLDAKSRTALIITIAATNSPWDMDSAALHRFGHILYVPLPDLEARKQILDIQIRKRGFTLDGNIEELARMLENYSGREIEQLANDAVKAMLIRSNPGRKNVAERGIEAIRAFELKIAPLRMEDTKREIESRSPRTDSSTLSRFQHWVRQARDT